MKNKIPENLEVKSILSKEEVIKVLWHIHNKKYKTIKHSYNGYIPSSQEYYAEFIKELSIRLPDKSSYNFILKYTRELNSPIGKVKNFSIEIIKLRWETNITFQFRN